MKTSTRRPVRLLFYALVALLGLLGLGLLAWSLWVGNVVSELLATLFLVVATVSLFIGPLFQRLDTLIKNTGQAEAPVVAATEPRVTVLEPSVPESSHERPIPYTVQGQITQLGGRPLAGVTVRAFDRDLRREAFLGQARTDERGRYTIGYTAQQFTRAEKPAADLLVRAYAPGGAVLGESPVRFTAAQVEQIHLAVSPAAERPPSEYEQLLATLAPVLDNLQPADLTQEDLAFLLHAVAGDRAVNDYRLHVLVQAARLARQTGLAAEAFYGVARVREAALPLDLDAFLRLSPEALRASLLRAIEANISPPGLRDALDGILARLEPLRLAHGVLVRRPVPGVVLNRETGAPLVGYRVHAFELDGLEGGSEAEPQDLGFDLSDGQGRFTVVYTAAAEADVPRRLRLQVATPDGTEIHRETIEVPPGVHDVRDVNVAQDPQETQGLTGPLVVLRVAVPVAPDPERVPLAQVATLADGTIPPHLLSVLAQHDVHTLADVRRTGGVRRLAGLSQDDPAARALDTLEAHANLALLTTDVAQNQHLIARGFPSVLSIASATQAEFLTAMAGDVGADRAVQFHVSARAQAHFVNQALMGIQADRASGHVYADAWAKHLEQLDPAAFRQLFHLGCACPDCDAAVSPLAYLADLLDYALLHVKRERANVTLAWLTGTFHQPFGALPAECEAVERQVRQVRLCIEVLRSYLKARWPGLPHAARDSGYLWASYTRLLTQLGTSSQEIRDAYAAPQEPRRALADRLGIDLDAHRPDQLDQLYLVDAPTNLPVAVLTEAVLEDRFGLVDTSRDPLAPGPTPKIRTWQLQHLRTLWRNQDWPIDDYRDAADDPLPVVDPDLIGPDDLRDPRDGQPAFALWKARREGVDGRYARLKQQREQDGLQSALDTLWTPLPDLDGLYHHLTAGNSQEVRTATATVTTDLGLTLGSFLRLMEISARDAAGQSVEEAEWGEVYDILLQVYKRRSFAAWRAEEKANGVRLGPAQFWISLREPRPGDWPPLSLEPPLIDPELLRLEDLPEPTAGARAIALWESRRGQLQRVYAALKTEREVHGVQAMLQLALGDPAPGDDLRYDLAALQKQLASLNPADVEEATSAITRDLHLSLDGFRRVMAVTAEAAQADPAKPPTPDDWREVYALLTSASKAKHYYHGWSGYAGWADEEANAGLRYWEAFKARLPAWRASAEARQAWQQALLRRSRAPLIDPDLIGPADLKSPLSGDAYQLWSVRNAWMQQPTAVRQPSGLAPARLQVSAVPQPAVQTLAGLETLLAGTLGVPPETLGMLAAQQAEGHDIAPRLEQLSLGVEAFARLLTVHQLLQAGAPVTPQEWQDVSSILAQVRKRRLFATWQQEEQERGIVLGPDHFRLSDAPLSTPPTQAQTQAQAAPSLPAWRATRQARQDWQDTLQARIDQEATAVQACDALVSATEEEVLPPLRDALVRASGLTAEQITKTLLIDARMSGCHLTTRVAQAIETIQVLLWSARTGQLITDAKPLVELDAEYFDEEWIWIGSYATWRAAMFTYLYPENILRPSLRTVQTPAFRQLVDEVGSRAELTPHEACAAAERYAVYFEDIAKITPEAAVQARTAYGPGDGDCQTGSATSQRDFVFAFGRSTRQKSANQVYFTYFTPVQTTVAQPGAAHVAALADEGLWFPVPGLSDVIELVGAVVYTIAERDRYIYLFARVQERENERLIFVRFDLLDAGNGLGSESRWGDPTPLALPDDAGQFTAVVKQRRLEHDPPHLAIRLPDGRIYAGQLNPDGLAWSDAGWELLVALPKGAQLTRLCAMIEPAPREFFLFAAQQIGDGETIAYRLFGHEDDGHWRILPSSSRWVGGFSWPFTQAVYAFWRPSGAEAAETSYQVIRRSEVQVETIGALQDYRFEDFTQFNDWLVSVSGFKLSDMRLVDQFASPHDHRSFVGMTYLEFFNQPFIELSVTVTSAEGPSGTPPQTNTYWLDPTKDNFGLPASIDIYSDPIEGGGTVQAYVARYLFIADEFAAHSAEQYIQALKEALTREGRLAWIDTLIGSFLVQAKITPRTLEGILRHLVLQKALYTKALWRRPYQPSWLTQYRWDNRQDGVSMVKMKRRDPDQVELSRTAYPTARDPDRLFFATGSATAGSATAGPADAVYHLSRQPQGVHRQVLIRKGVDDQLQELVLLRLAPQWGGPFEIPARLSNEGLELRRRQIEVAFTQANAAAPAPVLACLEEAWYFVPVYLALQLQRYGHFTQALDWLRTVYNYATASNRKIYYGLVREESLKEHFDRATDWLRDPLNPHSVAGSRRESYTRFTLLTMIRCLLDYADAEFTTDTGESIGRARTLYRTALELLAELGRRTPTCDELLIELDTIAVSDPQWAPMIGVTKQNAAAIGDPQVLARTLTAVRGALTGGGSWEARFTQAAARIAAARDVQASAPTMQTLLEARAGVQQIAHTWLLAQDEVAARAQSVGRAVVPGAGYSPADGGSHELGLVPGALSWRPLSYRFCIPANPVVEALRLHAENNLFKLRNCQNIAGLHRDLAPYAAPTDTVSGLPSIDGGGQDQIVLPGTRAIQPTIYRYQALIERAKQLVQLANQMEAGMLSALEHQEETAYTQLKARQDLELATAGVRLQRLRVTEARGEVALHILQQQRAQIEADQYQQLLDEGLSQLERDQLRLLGSVALYQAVAAGASFIGAATPSLRSIFSSGASNEEDWAKGFEYLAAWAGTTAQVAGTRASYERRRQDWELRRQLADQDIAIGGQQVQIALDRVNAAQHEEHIARLQASHASDTMNFLINKELNAELYAWMATVLEGVFRYFLQQATTIAKLAQDQLAFERQETPTTYIQADYWAVPTSATSVSSLDGGATDRHGLTGSARLLRDITMLDQHAFTTDRRKLQLSRTLSLARVFPIEFQRFRETGVLSFALPMDVFDRDFPGHYLRLIKRVRTSVIALIPPTESIRATLSTVGTSRVVIGSDGLFQTVPVKRSPESIALTGTFNATGLFELTPQPDELLLLPFEGLGVDTGWQLRMAKASNQFDYSTIADVLLAVDYTALESPEYRQQVIGQLDTRFSADRPFSFRQEFADAWYDLHNPELTAAPMVVRVQTRRQDFPPNVEELKVEHVVLYFARKDGATFEVPVAHLHFTEQGGVGAVGGGATSIDGIISTRKGNAGSWTAMLGKSPLGEWELALPTTAEMKHRFKDEDIEDMLLVVT